MCRHLWPARRHLPLESAMQPQEKPRPPSHKQRPGNLGAADHAAVSRLHHMARQQKIRNPLLDRILMPTSATSQFATLDTRLHEQLMQVLERLRRRAVFCYER